MRAISEEMFKISIRRNEFEITILKLLAPFPGAIELTGIRYT